MSDVLLKARSEPQVQRAFLGVGGAIYNQTGAQPFTLAKSNARGGYFGVDPAKLPNLPGSSEEIQSAAAILRSVAESKLSRPARRLQSLRSPMHRWQILRSFTWPFMPLPARVTRAARRSFFPRY